MSHTVSPHPTTSNRLGLDYHAQAASFQKLPYPIIDVHTHLSGASACLLYKEIARLYGIGMTFSMTDLDEIEVVRSVLGEKVAFIAVPNFRDPDHRWHFGEGYLRRIEAYHQKGVRIAKFWAAPGAREYGEKIGDPDFMNLDAPARLAAMELATSLDMILMAHVADPDTWFQTRYKDASQFGTKLDQYRPLRHVLDRFTQPWIIAHLGGWPEDLEFLTDLLEEHPNCHLDTSATKWMVREISKHEPSHFRDFITHFQGRILFGSDILTSDQHLQPPEEDATAYSLKANNKQDAIDLYASRYWALRTLFESNLKIPSPIADPDLALIDPEGSSPLDGPTLCGMALPDHLLKSVYHDAATALLLGKGACSNE